MKPVELNRTYECDDGIFNVKWWLERPKYKDIPCEWVVLGGRTICGEKGRFWCIECGLVVCKKHRRRHADSKQHEIRIREKGGKVASISEGYVD